MIYSNTDTALEVVEALHKADGRNIQFESGTELNISGGKITVAGVPVSDEAAQYLLENMQVKKGFIKKVGPGLESWEGVKDALRGLFVGSYLAMFVEDGVIKKIRAVNQKYSPTAYQEAGDELAQSISDITDRRVELSHSMFSDGKLILQFVNDNKYQLPYNELWRTGQSVCIDPFGVILEPYMERVVCANGMVRAVPTGKYSLTHGQSAEKLFVNKIGKTDSQTMEEIADGIKRMKENNASVREFFAFRDLINCPGVAELQRVIAQKPGGESGGFCSDHLIETYGDDLINKSERWLSTADSGINAFDVLNSATYIAGRAETFNMPADTVLRIQRLAAKTMLASLDMQHVAPTILHRVQGDSLAGREGYYLL